MRLAKGKATRHVDANPFGIVSFQVNPQNGCIVALARDGSLWIRSGAEHAHAQPWKRIPNPVGKPREESEDAITTTV
jgi:hypothetical protein